MLFATVLLVVILLVNSDPLCDLIAATNIQSVSSVCDSAGKSYLNSPCYSTAVWGCSGNDVVSLNFNNFDIPGITGKFLVFCNAIFSLMFGD